MTTDPTSEQLAALVRDFLDPDPCALDHHGYCQTHSWLCEGRCPHARAREVLAEYDAEQAASAGAAPADEPAPAGLGVSATPSHTDQAAAARVRALHQQYRFAGDDTTNYCAHCNLPWPCPTVQAVGEDAAAVLPPPADRAAVLREAVDTAYRIARRLDDQHHDERAKGAWDVENTLRAELRRLADEAQQQECTASISGSCLREAESETACDTDAGECVHGGRPAAEEPEQEPSVHGESVAHLAGLHDGRDQWADDEQDGLREETGAALARLIADHPLSEIQAAIRILGWPPLRFELVEDPEQQPADEEPAVPAPVHAIPEPGSNGISACCGRPPCEFVGERVTRDPEEVTCTGPAVDARQDGAQDRG